MLLDALAQGHGAQRRRGGGAPADHLGCLGAHSYGVDLGQQGYLAFGLASHCTYHVNVVAVGDGEGQVLDPDQGEPLPVCGVDIHLPVGNVAIPFGRAQHLADDVHPSALEAIGIGGEFSPVVAPERLLGRCRGAG